MPRSAFGQRARKDKRHGERAAVLAHIPAHARPDEVWAVEIEVTDSIKGALDSDAAVSYELLA